MQRLSGWDYPDDTSKEDLEHINGADDDEWGECDCGHSEKDHFEFKAGCAGEDGGGCECEGYEPTIRRGRQ